MSYTASGYPDYEGSSAIAGKKFLIYVKYNNIWNLIGGTRDLGLEISADAIDASSVDNDGWGESIPGTRSWTSSPSLVVKTNNVGDGIIENWVLDDTLQDEKPALLFAFVNKQDNTYYEGWGTVSSYSLKGSYNDILTKDMTINGVGAVTKKTGFAVGNSISPTTADFDKDSPADKEFTITTTATDFEVVGVKNGAIYLDAGDYSYVASTKKLTITKEYLATQSDGEHVLTALANYGNNLNVTITVSSEE